ncbi:ankyrin repeat domain-containing protein [Mucilaginibacter sp. AW1-7]|uniref:ankyrin repeat domain-containing protein n=1 Tax=Mucilaginibacter sp. AW1-7 TaxID=3349874 RepID=UPI003F73EB19
MKKLILLLAITATTLTSKAQTIPAAITAALKADDAAALTKQINKDNINACYGKYSLLAETIRQDAPNCFKLLIEQGAEVNKTCNGYLPPLMHAVKYGHLEMVKTLIAKGADKNYTYAGELKLTNGPEKGDTPFSYAKKYERDDILEYLTSLK